MGESDGGRGLRKIVHVDMDAFFASVEQRDAPELKGRPVAVGGSGDRAVVAAASYEARRFGVHSALPMRRALALCPDLVVVPPRFEAYRAVSREVREIFHRYSDLVEPLALDEAYLDVTHPLSGPPSATLIARAIKADVLRETGLTASAGVAGGKFLAKVASGMRKPDGLTVILPDEARAFIARLPIERFHGVGPRTAERMRALGITNGAELRARPVEELEQHFGKHGRFFHQMANGHDDRPVEPNRERKSIGSETTLERDLERRADLEPILRELCEEVALHLDRHGLVGRTVTVKLRFSDFRTITRSRTLEEPVTDGSALRAAAEGLAFETDRPRLPIRLLGVTVAQLAPAGSLVFQERIPYPPFGGTRP
ncbi:MAG: DNA polymerase IV [Trueperaceae bacterium]|jgi:DNA polymerase-4|nr:DNA polymerase IV [Trueperaceae bacterium]HRQ10890.1 DNA polymerase IV [Trueperaceae bacterium]